MSNYDTDSAERLIVRGLGRRIGFGNLMQLASREWEKQDAHGAFTIGPCKCLTVPCGCEKGCDWCEGSMLVTKKVKAVRDLYELNKEIAKLETPDG
jgi:hypothetical protein